MMHVTQSQFKINLFRTFFLILLRDSSKLLKFLILEGIVGPIKKQTQFVIYVHSKLLQIA